jgi:hypothetical protein
MSGEQRVIASWALSRISRISADYQRGSDRAGQHYTETFDPPAVGEIASFIIPPISSACTYRLLFSCNESRYKFELASDIEYLEHVDLAADDFGYSVYAGLGQDRRNPADEKSQDLLDALSY